MKYYYAIFIQTDEAIEVEFPDLPGCVTFGETWEEAYENAVDVLAGWLMRNPSLSKSLHVIQIWKALLVR